MYLGIVILLLYLPIIFTFFMVGEVFIGLVGVALAIAGGRGDFTHMMDFLRNSARVA
jgi:hypothetical protein